MLLQIIVLPLKALAAAVEAVEAAVEAVEAAAGSDTKLGSLVNICPTGNSDCKSFLATDFYFSTFYFR